MKLLMVILACFLICVTSSENCTIDQPIEDACQCGTISCGKGNKCMETESDTYGCSQNNCSDSTDPLGNSCFCNNNLCQKGNICSGNECIDPKAATPEKEESTLKKIVKTVVKVFLVGVTVAIPLSFVLCLLSFD